MTTLKTLSHASCIIKNGDKTLITDPWLIGSCYWRSWWNYPPVKESIYEDIKKIDAIYITHVHWDHWHGPSLKKFFPKETLIITHKESNTRSVEDLRSMGFNNIKLLKHGESFKLGSMILTAYQFGLAMNDSALVVETPEMKLLDANDCKIAGSSLRAILKKHGQFDFALRSHSSANDRVCYSIQGSDYQMDDENHYSRSFALFMNAVNPKFAVPFASNHCHLHKDVYHLNDLVNDPFKLEAYLSAKKLLKNNTQLKIMLSGDSWSSSTGFDIDPLNAKFFSDKSNKISEYKESVSNKLKQFYDLENKMSPNARIVEMFATQINSIPFFLRKKFKGFTYKMILFNDHSQWCYIVSPFSGTVEKCEEEFENGSKILIPVKIFIDSVALNMFHHSSISKRNKYIFDNETYFKKFDQFQNLLEYVELGVFPLRLKYILRVLSMYSRRWREVFIYGKAYLLSRKGMPNYYIEEEFLKDT